MCVIHIYAQGAHRRKCNNTERDETLLPVCEPNTQPISTHTPHLEQSKSAKNFPKFKKISLKSWCPCEYWFRWIFCSPSFCYRNLENDPNLNFLYEYDVCSIVVSFIHFTLLRNTFRRIFNYSMARNNNHFVHNLRRRIFIDWAIFKNTF